MRGLANMFHTTRILVAVMLLLFQNNVSFGGNDSSQKNGCYFPEEFKKLSEHIKENGFRHEVPNEHMVVLLWEFDEKRTTSLTYLYDSNTVRVYDSQLLFFYEVRIVANKIVIYDFGKVVGGNIKHFYNHYCGVINMLKILTKNMDSSLEDGREIFKLPNIKKGYPSPIRM